MTNQYQPRELTGSEIQSLAANGTAKHICDSADYWGSAARGCLDQATNANAEGKHGTAEEHRKNAHIAAVYEHWILSLLLPAAGLPKATADQLAELRAEVDRLTEDNDRANNQAQALSEEAGRLRENGTVIFRAACQVVEAAQNHIIHIALADAVRTLASALGWKAKGDEE